MMCPFKFNNKIGIDDGWVLGGGSLEAWGCLHNTKVVVCGFMGVKGGWVRES